MSGKFQFPDGWCLSPAEDPENYTDDLTRADTLCGVPCPIMVNESDNTHPIGMYIAHAQPHLRAVRR